MASSSGDVWMAPVSPVFAAPVKKARTVGCRRLAGYVRDGYSEWQIARAESLRVSAGLRDDEDFPAHVYPSSLPPVTSPVVVAVDLPIPPDYRVRPFLSASIPGVTVVIPELDDPASYPRPDAKLPPVERFFVDTSAPVDGWSTLDVVVGDAGAILSRAAGR